MDATLLQWTKMFSFFGAVTFLYGAKEEKFNNAVALKEYIEAKLKKAK